MFQTVLLALLLPPAGKSDLQQLINEAIQRNPEVLAAQKKLEAARQRPAQAGSLPDPVLSAGYASIGGPLPGQGLGREPMARIGFMASQTLPAAGKRDLRSRIALKDAGAAEQEYWQTQLSVVSRLKTAWHRLHHSYAMLDILARNRALTERMLKVSEIRYAAGQSAQADLLKAQIQLTLLDAKAAKLEQEKHSREAEINALLARPLETPVPRPPEMDAVESVATLAQLMEQAQGWSPIILLQQRNVERAELALNLARKEGSPDYTVSAGYYNMGAMPPLFEARLDFNLPVFTRARQRAATAEQANSLEAARRNYQATGNTLMFRIKDDYLMSTTAWRLLRIYSTTLVPQATLAVESSLVSYETGQTGFLTLLSNLMTLLEAEESYHEALMDYHLALVRLEEMTGMVLLEE
jgi:outer membrane protein TolC